MLSMVSPSRPSNGANPQPDSRYIGYYLAVSALWGVPYLFVSVAVKELSVPVIVFTRVFIGALILIPLALRSGC